MINSYKIDKGVLVPLEKKAIKSQGGFRRALWGIFGAIWVVVILLFAKFVKNPATEITLCSIIVAYCLYKVLLDAGVRAFFRYLILSKQVGGSSWTRVVAFEDDYIAVNDENIKRTYKYTQIKEIAQNDGYIVLILYGKQMIWLKADGFVDTTLEEIVALISVKREYS